MDNLNNQPSSNLPDTFDLLNDDKDTSQDNLLPNKDDKTTDENKEGTEPEKSDEKENENDELELENEEEKPEEDKFGIIVPPRKKEILAAYPDIFKKFPFIEHSLFGYKEYADMFGTVHDAKDVLEKSKKFDDLNEKVSNGNVESILESINKDKFNDVVDNLMPALYKKNPDAFMHIASGFAKSTIEHMIRTATDNKDEDLYKAAVAVHKFIFQTNQFTPHGKFGSKESSKPQELTEIEKKEKDFNERRLNSVKSEIQTKVDNQIKSTINNNIDPKNEMTDYIKRNAIRDALDEVNSILKQDTRFQTLIEQAYGKAAKSDFPEKDLSEIRSALQSKARTVLKEVINKARNNALKGMGKQVRERKEPENRTDNSNRRPATSNNSSNQNNNQSNKRPMSTYDFLSSD